MPLQVELDLIAPVVDTSFYPLNFDGLMYWSIERLLDTNDIEEELDSVLAKTGDVYRASQMLYVKSLEHPLSAEKKAFVTRTHWSEFDTELIQSKKSIKENEGVFKRKYSEVLQTGVKTVRFYMVADPTKVEFYIKSIIGVGRKANAGLGEIENVRITHVEEDLSWFYQGNLNRIVPVSLISKPLSEGVFVSECRYKPNYKTSLVSTCYVPSLQIIREVSQ